MKQTGRLSALFTAICVLICVFVSVSCATTVQVDTLVPGTVDMTAYKNIAVAPTIPYSGVTALPSASISVGHDFPTSFAYTTTLYVPDGVSLSAENKIVAALEKTGYFNITSPAETEKLFASITEEKPLGQVFSEKNIDAIVSTALTQVYWDEHTYSEPNYSSSFGYDGFSFTSFNYSLYQKVSIKLAVIVTDVKTGKVIASDSYEDYFAKDTKIYGSAEMAPNLGQKADEILVKIAEKVARLIAPTHVAVEVALMGNNPKSEAADAAFRLLNEGKTQDAYLIFLKEWEGSSHVSSGCNAAILLEVLGRPDEALRLCTEVYAASGDQNVGDVLLRMREEKRRRDQANLQMAAHTAAPEPDAEQGEN